MSTRPRRLQGVFLVAKDIDAQAEFYDAVLGLPMKFRDGDRWVQYDAGGNGFSLSCSQEARPAESGVVLVFEVDDFNGVAEDIERAGGRFLGVRDMGAHGAVLSMRDPEGNIVQMFRRTPRQPQGQEQ